MQYQTIQTEIDSAVLRVCESQEFILGPDVTALEREIAEYCGAEFALGVSSGTDALLLAMMALGIGRGHEVIVPPFSFFATAGSVARLGAAPVFVDIDPRTFNMDPSLLEAAITPRTKAIMPVHLFGQCADMDAIGEIAARNGVPIIEDAAQAMGASLRGEGSVRKAGTFGAAGCFSFFPSKNLGAFGDGGMVTCGDRALYEKMKLLRVHGAERRYYHEMLGGNFRLDSLQAAVLRVKLPHLDSWSMARRRNAQIYRELFADLAEAGEVVLPQAVAGEGHVYNQFVLRIPNRRDEVLSSLQAHGIGAAIYYPLCLHQQGCFSELGYGAGDFPVSELAASEVLALPIFPELTMEQLKRVATGVAAALA